MEGSPASEGRGGLLRDRPPSRADDPGAGDRRRDRVARSPAPASGWAGPASARSTRMPKGGTCSPAGRGSASRRLHVLAEGYGRAQVEVGSREGDRRRARGRRPRGGRVLRPGGSNRWRRALVAADASRHRGGEACCRTPRVDRRPGAVSPHRPSPRPAARAHRHGGGLARNLLVDLGPPPQAGGTIEVGDLLLAPGLAPPAGSSMPAGAVVSGAPITCSRTGAAPR